jgi:hypothetical protein
MRFPHRTFSGWHLCTGLLVIFALATGGCGGRPPTGTVTGTVHYRGQIVPAGKVTFYGPNNQTASAVIKEDGTYAATDVPLGEVKVAVTAPKPGPKKEVADKSPLLKQKGYVAPPTVSAVAIPPGYNDPVRSPLKLTVTEGSQPFDIDMK